LPHLAHTLLSFALVLGILVFVHELGHYFAARLGGVEIKTFSIGFGRTIASRIDSRGTEWRIGILPLGGYVMMRDEELPAEEAPANPGGSYIGLNQASLPIRVLVAAAGPLANFALAIVLFSALFAYEGREIPLPVIGEVMPHSAALAAGLKVGDRIEAINGTKIATFMDMHDIIASSAGTTLQIQILRDKAEQKIAVAIPNVGSESHKLGQLGVRPSMDAFITESLSPPAAMWAGVVQTYQSIGEILGGLGHLLATGQGADELGGPIQIAQLSGQVTSLGLASLVSFIAMLSVNLGLMNLLPIPVLDGGQLMFYAAEALRGRPLPARAQEYGYQVGVALIASVFVMISWSDLRHIGLFHWMAQLFG